MSRYLQTKLGTCTHTAFKWRVQCAVRTAAGHTFKWRVHCSRAYQCKLNTLWSYTSMRALAFAWCIGLEGTEAVVQHSDSAGGAKCCDMNGSCWLQLAEAHTCYLIDCTLA